MKYLLLLLTLSLPALGCCCKHKKKCKKQEIKKEQLVKLKSKTDVYKERCPKRIATVNMVVKEY